VFDMYWNWY